MLRFTTQCMAAQPRSHSLLNLNSLRLLYAYCFSCNIAQSHAKEQGVKAIGNPQTDVTEPFCYICDVLNTIPIINSTLILTQKPQGEQQREQRSERTSLLVVSCAFRVCSLDAGTSKWFQFILTLLVTGAAVIPG